MSMQQLIGRLEEAKGTADASFQGFQRALAMLARGRAPEVQDELRVALHVVRLLRTYLEKRWGEEPELEGVGQQLRSVAQGIEAVIEKASID